MRTPPMPSTSTPKALHASIAGATSTKNSTGKSFISNDMPMGTRTPSSGVAVATASPSAPSVELNATRMRNPTPK